MASVKAALAASSSSSKFAWLATLKAADLHRVAVATGVSCSGTKSVLMSEIERELCQPSPFELAGASLQGKGPKPARSGGTLSVVSIDMGIRNLAYAHLHVDVRARKNGASDPPFSSLPVLTDWQRLAVSKLVGSRKRKTGRENDSDATEEAPNAIPNGSGRLQDDKNMITARRESFDPSLMASYAYEFIHHIMRKHSPTHILIERQRFRSGGGSAVQEWTIRVGVFEGMLYAVSKTLAQERGLPVFIQGIDPARVGRFWLDGRTDPAGVQGVKVKATGAEGKKAKIDIVGKALEDPTSGLIDPTEAGDAQLRSTINAFQAKWKRTARTKTASFGEEVGKLDDLADCLLQGVAWIRWQNMRREAVGKGWEAFALDSDEKSDASITKNGSKVNLTKIKTVRARGTATPRRRRELKQAG